jgi:hypothetical protein
MSVRQERKRAFIASAVLLGTFPAAFVAKHWIVTTTLILCPFRAVTGRLCVFCGLTRALAYATHGEFSEAYRLHPFWWAAAALIGLMGLASLVKAVHPSGVAGRLAMWRPADSWLFVALVVAGSVLRALFGEASG